MLTYALGSPISDMFTKAIATAPAPSTGGWSSIVSKAVASVPTVPTAPTIPVPTGTPMMPTAIPTGPTATQTSADPLVSLYAAPWYESTGAKVGLAVGAVAILGTLGYLIAR